MRAGPPRLVRWRDVSTALAGLSMPRLTLRADYVGKPDVQVVRLGAIRFRLVLRQNSVIRWWRPDGPHCCPPLLSTISPAFFGLLREHRLSSTELDKVLAKDRSAQSLDIRHSPTKRLHTVS